MTTMNPRRSPAQHIARWSPLALTLAFGACNAALAPEPDGASGPEVLMAAARATRDATCRGALVTAWRGAVLAPAGRARIGVGDDANPVAVSNIGSSGQDGVCVGVPDGGSVASFAWDIDDDGVIETVGSRFDDDEGSGFGQKVSVERAEGARGPRGAGSFRIVHRFGTGGAGGGGGVPVEDFTLNFSLGGVVQASGTVRPNARGESVLGVGRCAVDPNGPCDGIVGYEWDLDNDGVYVDVSLRLAAPTLLRAGLPDRREVTADEIRLRLRAPLDKPIRNAVWTFEAEPGKRGTVSLTDLVVR